MRAFLAILIVMEALVFLVAALMHLGVRVPVGFTEPPILPAAVAEGLIGIFFAVAAYGVLTHRKWAWIVAVAAHVFAEAGILLGMAALAAGRGPSTEANEIYHRTTLIAALAIMVLLWTRPVRRALRRQPAGHVD